MKGLNDFAKEVHQGNVKRGFYENEKNIGEMLALIHSEVSEALEADRKNKHCRFNNGILVEVNNLSDENFKSEFLHQVKDTFEDELADVIIRVLDLCAYRNIDIEQHIIAKNRYNSMREYKHGKKY